MPAVHNYCEGQLRLCAVVLENTIHVLLLESGGTSALGWLGDQRSWYGTRWLREGEGPEIVAMSEHVEAQGTYESQRPYFYSC